MIRQPFTRFVAFSLINVILGIVFFLIQVQPLPPKSIESSSMIGRTEKIIEFGTYEQDNNPANGKENIVWHILSSENNKTLLICEKSLDCNPYNENYKPVTWADCALRKWLNTGFISIAFTEEEKKLIATTTLVNDENPENGTAGGIKTDDKIFLLSIREAEKYFADNDVRKAANTSKAMKQGADSDTYGNGSWWLRSPGSSSYSASCVRNNGTIDLSGANVNSSGKAVRPAIWINLKSASVVKPETPGSSVMPVVPLLDFPTIIVCVLTVLVATLQKMMESIVEMVSTKSKKGRLKPKLTLIANFITMVILVSPFVFPNMLKIFIAPIFTDLRKILSSMDYLMAVTIVGKVEVLIFSKYNADRKNEYAAEFKGERTPMLIGLTSVLLILNFCILLYFTFRLHIHIFTVIGILMAIGICIIESLYNIGIIKHRNHLAPKNPVWNS